MPEEVVDKSLNLRLNLKDWVLSCSLKTTGSVLETRRFIQFMWAKMDWLRLGPIKEIFYFGSLILKVLESLMLIETHKISQNSLEPLNAIQRLFIFASFLLQDTSSSLDQMMELLKFGKLRKAANFNLISLMKNSWWHFKKNRIFQSLNKLLVLLE